MLKIGSWKMYFLKEKTLAFGSYGSSIKMNIRSVEQITKRVEEIVEKSQEE